MNTNFDYDLFVIGGGSGGVRAAKAAAALGAKVAIAEQDRFGGTCVNRGCVPKKLLMYASHFSEHFEDAKGFGWDLPEKNFSWQNLISAKNQEITRLSQLYENNLIGAKATIFNNTASLINEHTIQLNGSSPKTVTSRFILIATGGKPSISQVSGIEYAISSNQVFDLKELPKRVLIIGTGYVGLEFACIFKGLGSEVFVACRGTEILGANFDLSLKTHLKEELLGKGIDFKWASELEKIEKMSNHLTAVFKGGKDILKNIDVIMVATGRKPNIDQLNLQQLGIELRANSAIQVNEYGQSSIPSIYAVGDVSSRISLTPVALHEGNAVAQTLFGKNPIKIDLSLVPSAVFTQPALATVGLTELQALDKYQDIDVYESHFKNLKSALSKRNEKVFMKLVVDKKSQKILGAHMIGEEAPEIIQALSIAIQMGATKSDFDSTIAIHPTIAEEFVTMRVKNN
ncbi:MAG: glutathione-disulfide reductase [Polynucleobacter sp.]|nr:glutathione-disulfide reductase [Polynucleobacter sp.]